MHMSFVDNATHCLRQWVVSIITLLVKRQDLFWQKKTFNICEKTGKRMKCGNSKSKINVTLLLRCRTMKGGNSTWLMCPLKNTSKDHYHTSIIEFGTFIRQDEVRRIVWLRRVCYQSSRNSEKTICQFPTIFQKYKYMLTRCWTNEAAVCWKGTVIDSTATNVTL